MSVATARAARMSATTAKVFTQRGTGGRECSSDVELTLFSFCRGIAVYIAVSANRASGDLHQRSGGNYWNDGRRIVNEQIRQIVQNLRPALELYEAMMTRNESDMRANHTRAMLQRAFKVLLRTKPYESIAVDEICKLANVGRSTFYTHFRSKDDLKRSGLETLRRQLHERQRKSIPSDRKRRSAPLSFTFDLFAHARDHLDHYRMLADGRGRTIILRKLKDTATGLVRAQFNANSSTKSHDAIEREASVQCVVGAFMALLTWWLDRGATIPAERIDAMFQCFVRDGALLEPR